MGMFRHLLRNRKAFDSIRRAKNHARPAQTETNILSNLETGNVVKGWTVKETGKFPEFNMTAALLEHSSGGQLLNVQRADPNATFSVGFRTVPMNSTGLPHILEHTVLCGSERYPCRDPFFNMLNRSLATFMNAMTAPDCTFYPFSSQNPQDCQNLQSVYLDAVFRPRLHKADFQQEGWRLEHEVPEDASTPIVIKGVVFNEMKGVFSDNQALYFEALMNGLLPSHTYGVCSGGLPLHIPRLQHQDLVKFHKEHYTAANARFFMYGELPIETHLAAIEPYLQSGAEVPPVPSEPRWTQPRRSHISCRRDPMAADPAKQSSISTSYLCCDIRDIDEVFTLTVLSQLLVSGPNASFYKTLVEPGFGAGLAPTTGYESQIRDTFFSIGLQGVDPQDFHKIEKIIVQTLVDVSNEGFPEERIEAFLHSIELGVKHQNANFGLSLLFGVTPVWNHDGDVLKSLGIEQRVAKFRENLKKDPELLQKKIKQYLLSNEHRLVLTMTPSDDFEEKQKTAEEALLQEKLSALTDDDRKCIYEQGLQLLESRKQNNKDVLPTLRVADISKEINEVEVVERLVGSVPVSVFPQPTNGVTYFRALLATDDIEPRLQPYLSLFAHVLPKMGTKKRSFKEFDQEMSLYTGGLGVGCHTTQSIRSAEFEGSLILGSHCLDRNISHMFDLWQEVLEEGDLEDSSRFGTLVKAQAAELVNSVPMAGHHYAMLGAAALVSAASARQEAHSGMAYLSLLKRLAANDVGAALHTMQEVRAALKDAKIRCAVNALPNTDLQPLDALLARLGLAGRSVQLKGVPPGDAQCVGTLHVLPFDVSYAAQVIPTVPYTHPDFAALRILSRLLTSKYFHPEVREKGGAYGGGASLSAAGLLSYYSYRDPSPANSLQVFDGAGDWLRAHKPSAVDVEEAKLGVFQAVDAPVAPGDRGSRRFLQGITDEEFSAHRRRLMDVSVDDLMRVAEGYLTLPAGRCVLGPNSDNLHQTSQSQYSWTVIDN